MAKELILASASPRRSELLSLCGLKFKVCAANIDEKTFSHETLEEAIRRLSLEKAEIISAEFPSAFVLGADTDVVIDNEILGKPQDEAQAVKMLKLLSGRQHEVIGAFSLVCHAQQLVITQSSITKVYFRTLSQSEIEQYVATKEPFGKAGAYAIQGLAMPFIEKIEGSYPNVVGLDIPKFMEVWSKL